jgi:RNA polymerase sigma-70 factor (ECF subfamily)
VEVTVGRARRLRAVTDDIRSEAERALQAVAAGDPDALGVLFDLLGGRVFAVVKAVVRDPAQSEEVTQEVMLEVWRTAPRFRADRGSATGWVLTIAHRRAIDRVRSEQASRDRIHAVGARDQQRPFDEVVEQVEHADERAQLTDALEVLSDAQRQAVELAYYDGLTYRQVAERLDVPLGTIKTRMREALIRLRDAMEVTR